MLKATRANVARNRKTDGGIRVAKLIGGAKPSANAAPNAQFVYPAKSQKIWPAKAKVPPQANTGAKNKASATGLNTPANTIFEQAKPQAKGHAQAQTSRSRTREGFDLISHLRESYDWPRHQLRKESRTARSRANYSWRKLSAIDIRQYDNDETYRQNENRQHDIELGRNILDAQRSSRSANWLCRKLGTARLTASGYDPRLAGTTAGGRSSARSTNRAWSMRSSSSTNGGFHAE